MQSMTHLVVENEDLWNEVDLLFRNYDLSESIKHRIVGLVEYYVQETIEKSINKTLFEGTQIQY